MYGDLTGDRKVDMRDVALAARAFGTAPGDERWNPIADINSGYERYSSHSQKLWKMLDTIDILVCLKTSF